MPKVQKIARSGHTGTDTSKQVFLLLRLGVAEDEKERGRDVVRALDVMDKNLFKANVGRKYYSNRDHELLRCTKHDKVKIHNKQCADIAQWVCICLPYYRPGFESQAHHPRFHQFIELCNVVKYKNKQKKEVGISPFLKSFTTNQVDTNYLKQSERPIERKFANMVKF